MSQCHCSIFHSANRSRGSRFAESWHYKALDASVSAGVVGLNEPEKSHGFGPCCSMGTAHWVCRYGAESEKWLQSFTAGQFFSLTPYYLFIVMHPCSAFKHHLLLPLPHLHLHLRLQPESGKTSCVARFLQPSYFSLNVWKYSLCVSTRRHIFYVPIGGLIGRMCLQGVGWPGTWYGRKQHDRWPVWQKEYGVLATVN